MNSKYSFNIKAFEQEDFNVTSFLEKCMKTAPLETVKEDLAKYLEQLQQELVDLINRDYADFLQLSSKLVGVDISITALRSPIVDIEQKLSSAKFAVQTLQDQIDSKLAKKAALRSRREELELCIEVSQKLGIIEDLLGQETDMVGIDEKDVNQEHTQDPAVEDLMKEYANFSTKRSACESNRDEDAAEICARLERASRMTVSLSADMLKGAEILFIQANARRVSDIEDLVLRRLEQEFATEIVPDDFYHRGHTINVKAAIYCLRAYSNLGKVSLAEDMISRLVIEPFAQECITTEKLDGKVRGSCEGLKEIYNSIIEFVDKHFGEVLVACTPENGLSDVNILCNGIWKELCNVIMQKLPEIFKPGIPQTFHKNFISSMAFLRGMERFCKNDTEVGHFRKHPATSDFMNKWNLDIYYQLVYLELTSSLSKSLREPCAVSQNAAITHGEFVLPATRELWNCLDRCWDDGVFISAIRHKFMKLSLVLLSTYTEWLDGEIAKINHTSPSLEELAPCFEVFPNDIIYSAHDCNLLSSKIQKTMMPRITKEIDGIIDTPDTFLLEILEPIITRLNNIIIKCWKLTSTPVAEECKIVLQSVRMIKNLYQMTNKPAPTTFSNFVPNILRPVRKFCDDWGAYLTDDMKISWIDSIVTVVCENYYKAAAELLKSAKELEESLRNRKIRRPGTMSQQEENSGLSDTDKMRVQLLLDVKEFGRDAEDLGMTMTDISSYKMLIEEVLPAEQFLTY